MNYKWWGGRCLYEVGFIKIISGFYFLAKNYYANICFDANPHDSLE